ncbi:N-acetyltransferase [Paenibacillus sp. sptzw28]|uniref:GNAT family N-acetyltransferase n=1 Tax=Paenibacillus sp. sptzw28 TaxID=715179 RepID=UPI001C6E607A|nr:GNAT family N-acetyltransferase [Paenibacillus sp. sptzw28]QYR21491.1 N-acetyltransferase [Paenibacillus sp. sptzw28]
MGETVKEGNGFITWEDGVAVAEITFVTSGEDTLIIDHTFVLEAMRGRKLAEDLVQRVVEYARETNKKIVPACSYAHALFRRRKEYHDIWER